MPSRSPVSRTHHLTENETPARPAVPETDRIPQDIHTGKQVDEANAEYEQCCEEASPGRLPASRGVAAVAADHRVTPDGSTLRPPNLDTMYPPGIWVAMYPAKKLDCTKPDTVAFQWKSRLIAMIATDMFTLSWKHNVMV